jgi:uridylate kinase
MEEKPIIYKRVLLKITGETFASTNKVLDFKKFDYVASIIERIRQRTKVQIAIVLGAGNILRGREVEGTNFDHAVADQMGMLATVINSLALQEAIEKLGNNTRVMSAISMPQICELYIRRRALRHMEKGRIVILAGGTGNPYFTTDSAAALRAIELKCDVILKASTVDGIYTKDPKKFSDAQKLDFVDYQTALEKGLKIMDNTAFALCQARNMPIIVFNFNQPENIEKILRGEKIGTLVADKNFYL